MSSAASQLPLRATVDFSGHWLMIVSTLLNDGEVMPAVRKTMLSSKKNQLFFAARAELIGASSIADTPLRPSPVPPAKLRVPKPYWSFAVSAFCSTVMPGRRVQSSAGQESLPKYSSPLSEE